eukprot:snap_masked-scaffold_1-processed-gene-22.27-mRNA-1 protein AED:1.00 eAED:1.00 QI:0/-1/0/0/-1/1/1/0/81
MNSIFTLIKIKNNDELLRGLNDLGVALPRVIGTDGLLAQVKIAEAVETVNGSNMKYLAASLCSATKSLTRKILQMFKPKLS